MENEWKWEVRAPKCCNTVEMTASTPKFYKMPGKWTEQHIQTKNGKKAIPKTIPDPFPKTMSKTMSKECPKWFDLDIRMPMKMWWLMTIFPYYKKAINGIYTIFKHTHMLFFGEKGCLLPRAAMSHNIWTPSLHCDNYIYIYTQSIWKRVTRCEDIPSETVLCQAPADRDSGCGCHVDSQVKVHMTCASNMIKSQITKACIFVRHLACQWLFVVQQLSTTWHF